MQLSLSELEANITKSPGVLAKQLVPPTYVCMLFVASDHYFIDSIGTPWLFHCVWINWSMPGSTHVWNSECLHRLSVCFLAIGAMYMHFLPYYRSVWVVRFTYAGLAVASIIIIPIYAELLKIGE